MSRTKPAKVRFYVDADLLGLAHILVRIRSDVTYPGDPGDVIQKRERPPCPVTKPKTDDDVWIPEVTSHNWLIITRDRHIQTRPPEIQAVVEHGARMVRLSGKEAVGTFAQLEVLMCRWREVLACLDESGPFILTITRTTSRWVLPPPGQDPGNEPLTPERFRS